MSVMKAFTINTQDQITAFRSRAEASQCLGEQSLVFSTEEEWKRIAAEWPGGRLAHIWNYLPGIHPVQKFTDRRTAAARIWKAIQNLEPCFPAEEGAQGQRRPATKTAAILEMLRRPEGATLPEMMDAMGWQAHSVRGFLSNLRRRGQSIDSRKRDSGQRAYFLPEPPPAGSEQAS